jgi:hypothetical protein
MIDHGKLWCACEFAPARLHDRNRVQGKTVRLKVKWLRAASCRRGPHAICSVDWARWIQHLCSFVEISGDVESNVLVATGLNIYA